MSTYFLNEKMWIAFVMHVQKATHFYTPPHDSGRVLCYHVGCPCVRVSIHLSIHLSVVSPSVFSFPDDNLSNCQWIFTKLGVCFDIVEIWFWIVNGQMLLIFDSYLPTIRLYFHFRMITWVTVSGFSPNSVCALILWRSGFGLLMDKCC